MLEIYTDGAYSSLRDKGGWAFVVLSNGEKIYHDFSYEFGTTNNRMEIQAALEACYWLRDNKLTEATIYADSLYVINTMTQNWRRKKNNDLWDLFDEVIKDLQIHWSHVKGHSGNKYNELCDAFASQASQ